MLNKLRSILQSLHWSVNLQQEQFLVAKKAFWRPHDKVRKWNSQLLFPCIFIYILHLFIFLCIQKKRKNKLSSQIEANFVLMYHYNSFFSWVFVWKYAQVEFAILHPLVVWVDFYFFLFCTRRKFLFLKMFEFSFCKIFNKLDFSRLKGVKFTNRHFSALRNWKITIVMNTFALFVTGLQILFLKDK